jgi:1-aminocyclopropane-1-carboxylate deaminase
MVFAVMLGWFPVSGRGEVGEFLGIRSSLFTLDGLQHITLPAVNLAIGHLALVIRLARSGVREVEPQDYIRFARANGMQLVPVSRPDYRRRADPDYIDALRGQYGPCYLIPEGGANEAGVRGCQEMAGVLGALIPDLDGCEIALACGTGTTLAGLVSGLRLLRAHHNAAARPFVRGVAVLKGAGFLRQDIRRWLACVGSSDTDEDWGLETDYHGGGYARADQGLLDFVAQFGRVHDIALEPVYTGKLLHALYQRIGDGHYPAGSRIVMLHTGGLRAGPDGD